MKTWELLSDYRDLKEGDKKMHELVIPFKVNMKIGKTKNRYPLGNITIKTRYKVGLAAGLCWVSFKIFLMGIKKFIE